MKGNESLKAVNCNCTIFFLSFNCFCKTFVCCHHILSCGYLFAVVLEKLQVIRRERNQSELKVKITPGERIGKSHLLFVSLG